MISKSKKILLFIPQTRDSLEGVFASLESLELSLSIHGISPDLIKILVITDRQRNLNKLKEWSSKSKLNINIQTLSLNSHIKVKISQYYAKQIAPRLRFLPSPNMRWLTTYAPKIFQALDFAKSNNIEFILKCDEDIILMGSAWRKLFQATCEEHLWLSPVFVSVQLTTGLPTWIDFAKSNLSDCELNQILSELICVDIPSSFLGYDYSPLKQECNHQFWDEDLYLIAQNNLGHKVRGFHPIRFSASVCTALNNKAIDELQKYYRVKQSSQNIYYEKEAYFCNNVFLTRIEHYSLLVSRGDCFVDPFDEIPLNTLVREGIFNIKYISDSPSLHFLYNHGHSEAVAFQGELLSGAKLESAMIERFRAKLTQVRGASNVNK